MQAGSDKGRTANCSLKFPLNANQQEQYCLVSLISSVERLLLSPVLSALLNRDPHYPPPASIRGS